VRAHQPAIDSQREWRSGRAERRGFEIFVRPDNRRSDFFGKCAFPFQVAAVGGFRVGPRSREDVEGGRGMGVSGANQNRIGRDAGLGCDALADVVGDALAEREKIDAGDGDLPVTVAEHERLRGEIVVHALVAADAAAVTEHREADGRIELYPRGAGAEGTHASLTAASSVALEATFAAAPMMSPMSRSSPSRHSCGIETIACSKRRSATGQSMLVLAEAPASSQALR